jgi:hypothetical protein
MASACLLMAGDDYQQCHAQIENYKTCKRFWVNHFFVKLSIKTKIFSRLLYECLLQHIIY